MNAIQVYTSAKARVFEVLIAIRQKTKIPDSSANVNQALVEEQVTSTSNEQYSKFELSSTICDTMVCQNGFGQLCKILSGTQLMILRCTFKKKFVFFSFFFAFIEISLRFSCIHANHKQHRLSIEN